GGGRCNFTHLHTQQNHFISANPAFCISALKRYTPQDFLELAERHGVEWIEKTVGQLFCIDSSKPILDLLLTECEWAGVEIRTKQDTSDVYLKDDVFTLIVNGQTLSANKLVVATGGLSIPTLGGSPFGYQLAERFGHNVLSTRAGLVPFTLPPEVKESLAELSGLSTTVTVKTLRKEF